MRQAVTFKELKKRMCASPVLMQPDFKCKFYLQVDASAYSMGAILSQKGGNLTPTLTRQQKLTLHPIAYYSTIFTPTK
jgi:RNase H-like domain found in reverse transcriptase